MTLPLPSPSPPASVAPPANDVPHLALTTYLSRWHSARCHQLSASESESMPLGALLALADAEDAARWAGLRLEYTDPLGADWLRETIAASYEHASAADVTCFAGAQEGMHAAMHATLACSDHAVVVTPGYQSLETIPLGI